MLTTPAVKVDIPFCLSSVMLEATLVIYIIKTNKQTKQQPPKKSLLIFHSVISFLFLIFYDSFII